MVHNTIQEMLAFFFEWFFEADIWDEHISIAIVTLKITIPIRIWRNFNPFVVDLDLLIAIEIVVDNHFLATDHGNPPNFTRVDPTDVYVSKYVVWKDQVHVNIVKYAVERTFHS